MLGARERLAGWYRKRAFAPQAAIGRAAPLDQRMTAGTRDSSRAMPTAQAVIAAQSR